MAKILIVDDEEDIVRLLAVRLRARNYEVVSALDCVEAVTQAQKEKPDLVILDIKMPGEGGLYVFEKLRKSSQTASIPIIFHSALPPLEVEKKVEELGADGYITKPFDTDVFLAKVRELAGE